MLSIPGNPRNRCGRQLLMLTAALAVGVPGCLASLAACGQSGSQAQAQAQAQAPTRAQQPARGEASPDLAISRSQRARKKSSPAAVTLLTEAAQQGVQQTYLGEEIVLDWGGGGGTALDSTVYHKSGGPTFTQTQAAGSSQPFVSPDLEGQSPEGVLGVTSPLVQLLKANYVLSYTGNATVDDRPAQVVRVSRGDGTVAAEYWLDAATKLPLERKVYDNSSQLISLGTFTIGEIGTSAQLPVFVSAAQPAATVVWSYPIAPPQLRTLTQEGWVVPAGLPGGLILFTGGETTTATGRVLDLAYSDGLYVVSVFEQRGKLAAKLAGWQKTKVAGQVVYAAVPDQHSLTWSGHDVVYTLIADAPPQTVANVVGKLPHDEPLGFWKRISRGFTRIVHLVNPFG